MTNGNTPALVVQRVEPYADPDTDEITSLAEAAGYTVVGEVVQSRKEDPEFNIGSGKVDELFRLLAETDAEKVIFDNRLGPYQTYNIGLRLQDDIPIIDRFLLILEIFAARADTRKAQLQVELAHLRYELPRAEAKASLAKREEHPGFMGLGEYDETRERDIKKQISRIRDKLNSLEKRDENRRKKRREEGFDLVSLAGYTNAGKTTLLQRLAEELSVGQNEDLHPDIDPTAKVNDDLFTTLTTTTRRLALEGRNAIITDTAGFVSDLPHWMVESFKPTLNSVYESDLILLVVDVSEPEYEIREKLITSLDVLRGRSTTTIIPVLNKIDQISEEELDRKREALSDIARQPVCISAKNGINIDELQQRIKTGLPPLQYQRLFLPQSSESMSILSWIHNNAHVDDVSYTDDNIIVEFKGTQKAVQKALSRVKEQMKEPSST